MKHKFITGALIFVLAVITAFAIRTVDVTKSCVVLFNDYGHGSGAIIGPNEVLTAKHVAKIPGIRVRTADGDEHAIAKIVFDPNSDLARVYIEDKFDERPLVLDRTPLRVGDKIAIVGTPYVLDLMNCVAPGRVVKVNYETEVMGEEYVNMDVHDCHTAGGCSGGPVVDRKGRIRGIQVLIWSPYGSAVPVEELDP